MTIIYSCLAVIVAAIPSFGKNQPACTANHLRVEYCVNPLGIDAAKPRLSWEVVSEKRAQRQLAYQILVGTDSLALTKDKVNVWNSGKVTSAQSNQIAYAGARLTSKTTYYWKVRLWDAEGQVSDWSPIASWSMGLLQPTDWKAQWIGAPEAAIPNSVKLNSHYGYQSEFTKNESEKEYLTLDLGNSQTITEIKLYPVDYKDNPDGYLFPKRFIIEIAASSDFKNSIVFADESKRDFSKKGLDPYVAKVNSVKGRYVRVAVTRLAKATTDKYAFALAELEVITNQSVNAALKRPVKATSNYTGYTQYSTESWLPDLLTDGFYRSNANHKSYSLPIPPSPLLRKTFSVTKRIKKATLYASAKGLYEISINGKKAGNQVLAPEWTDYHKRFQYQTYDVTDLLKSGHNAIGAMLADGWYAGVLFSHPERGSYGFDRRLIGQLEIVFEDGTTGRIVTDGSWKVLKNGPIQSASLFDGETFNAGLLPTNWQSPDFDDSKWESVVVDSSFSQTLSAQANEPIRVIQEITPVAVTKVKDSTYIFDLGQNIAGWINLKLSYNPHAKITFRHGEVLDDNGQLYVANLRGARQIDVYIPGTEHQVNYEPRFTYHGFRYVEISGLSHEPEPANVTGKVVASASHPTGYFECSSKDLNKLWQNILWTQRGNMHSVPTDCPQRDERAGWMGDAQVFSQTSIFNMDMGAFYTKWMRDLRDSQLPDGRYPDYAPQVRTFGNFYNAPGWADAGVLIPWKMYENYNDLSILATQYESMKAYVDNIRKFNPGLLWKNARGNSYGDWLNGDWIISKDYPKEGGKVPDDVYSSAFFYKSTQTLAKVAGLLNKKKDKLHYDSLATGIRNAFITEYISSDGSIQGNTQAGYALALEFGLVPEPLKKSAAAHMVEALKKYDYRISTGIQSTIRLMNQLSEHGYSDIAYQLIESHRFPSWLYSVDQGATTIWERWDGYVKGRGFQNVGMNSFNHYAIGAVGEWMYRSILGINADQPGYKHIVIKPQAGGSLKWAKGSYHAIAGTIGVEWETTADAYTLKVNIPANTTAKVILPVGKKLLEGEKSIDAVKAVRILESNQNGTSVLVPSGTYHFTVVR